MRIGTLTNILRRIEGVGRLAREAGGSGWSRWVRVLLGMAVVAWLAYQLSEIGWVAVWEARPRNPLYYLIWIGLYFQLPLVESLIYRMIWKLPAREVLPPLLRKRVLNQDVATYSGEFYLFVWLRRKLGLSDRQILGVLKDNAIASFLGSWTSTALFVGVFLFSGQIVLVDLIGQRELIYVSAGAVLSAVLLTVGLRFRRSILTLPTKTAAAVFGMHVGRLVVLAGLLQILQWWIVLPDAPLSVWATIFAVLSVVNRIPLIPARDLVGIGAVIGFSDHLAASATAIAAILLTRSVMDKTANGLLFVLSHVVERMRSRAAEAAEPVAAE